METVAHPAQTRRSLAGADHASPPSLHEEAAPNRVRAGCALSGGLLTEIELVFEGGARMLPRVHDAQALARGKRILICGLAGGYAVAADRRLAKYVRCADALRGNGIDEIWCVAINNPYIMGLWGLDADSGARVRLMSDRHGAWTRSLGLVAEASMAAIQVGASAYSLLVDDGVVSLVSPPSREPLADAVLEAVLAEAEVSSRFS